MGITEIGSIVENKIMIFGGGSESFRIQGGIRIKGIIIIFLGTNKGNKKMTNSVENCLQVRAKLHEIRDKPISTKAKILLLQSLKFKLEQLNCEFSFSN